MKALFFAMAIFLAATISVAAQKGVAEPGYYPMDYNGDTWTGEVTNVNEESRELTLTYRKGDKEQTFVAIVPKGFTLKNKEGKAVEVPIADLLGWKIKIYYINRSKKDSTGTKIKYAEVIDIKIFPKGK